MGGLNGTPGDEMKPVVAGGELPPNITGKPLLSTMPVDVIVTLDDPLCVAKETVAITPLPENVLVLMIAILTDPGLFALAASIAPLIRLP